MRFNIATLVESAKRAATIYTQLVEFEGDEYYSAVVGSVVEAKRLIEAGFEYVFGNNEPMLFRKRK